MSTDISSTEYTVVVYKQDGTIVGYITDFSDIAIGQVTNGYNTFQVSVLYDSLSASYLDIDSLILVYRQNFSLGIPSSLVFGGTIIKTVITEAPVTTLTASAFGFEEILTRRIVAWKDTARGKVVFPENKTAGFEYASSIIRKLINTNIGSQATATLENYTNLVGTGRMINGVITQFNDVPDNGDFGLAISSYDGIAKQNLLSTVQEVAQEGHIGFELVWDPVTNNYSFNMNEDRIGADRTNSVIFSIGNGSVESIETTIDYSQSWNVALMNGGGKGASERRYVYPESGKYPKGVNQRETYLTSATGQVKGNRATAVLEYKNMQKSLTQVVCSIQQTAGLLFGRDYFIGDLVSVVTAAGILELQVKQVTLSMSSDGVETIGVTLESE